MGVRPGKLGAQHAPYIRRLPARATSIVGGELLCFREQLVESCAGKEFAA
jgi:hypothetical protein